MVSLGPNELSTSTKGHALMLPVVKGSWPDGSGASNFLLGLINRKQFWYEILKGGIKYSVQSTAGQYIPKFDAIPWRQNRAHRFPLPDGPGQVKLPVGQVDLSEFLFYILYKQTEKLPNWAKRGALIYHLFNYNHYQIIGNLL